LVLIREIKPTYRDAISARMNLIYEIKKIIIQHPLLAGKLKLPDMEIHRLRHLLNQRFHSTILLWSLYAFTFSYFFATLISAYAFHQHIKFIYCSMCLSLNWQKHQRPDQEPDLLRDHDSNSKPSASALTNSGKGTNFLHAYLL